MENWIVGGIVAAAFLVYAICALKVTAEKEIKRYMRDESKQRSTTNEQTCWEGDGASYRHLPRCDVTGQPLTPREQFDNESG